jgi:SAM-dependent methyltransferase
LHPAGLPEIGFWNVGWDLLLGGFLVGLILAPVAGLAAWTLSDRGRRPERWSRTIEEAARPYLETGVRHWEFVRGKLRHDPLYLMIHERLESRRGGTVLDLGCGVGIALSLLDAQERIAGAPDASPRRDLLGVDHNVAVVRVAGAALDGRARIEVSDLAAFEPPAADVVLLLDVLHYLDAAAQERILAAACRALRPGGLLLLREPDAAGGRQFLMTRGAERAMAILRGHLRQRFHYRSGAEWLALVRSCGLDVTVTNASRGTPFANVLIEGRSAQARSVGRASISE